MNIKTTIFFILFIVCNLSACEKMESKFRSVLNKHQTVGWQEYVDVDELTKDESTYIGFEKSSESGVSLQIKMECRSSHFYDFTILTQDGHLVNSGFSNGSYSGARLIFGTSKVRSLQVKQSGEFNNQYNFHTPLDYGLDDLSVQQPFYFALALSDSYSNNQASDNYARGLKALLADSRLLHFALELTLHNGEKVLIKSDENFNQFVLNKCLPLAIKDLEINKREKPISKVEDPRQSIPSDNVINSTDTVNTTSDQSSVLTSTDGSHDVEVPSIGDESKLQENKDSKQSAAGGLVDPSVLSYYLGLMSRKIVNSVDVHLCPVSGQEIFFEMQLNNSGDVLEPPKLIKGSGDLVCDEEIQRAIIGAKPFDMPEDSAARAKLISKVHLKIKLNRH